jgi:hypothetical protein
LIFKERGQRSDGRGTSQISNIRKMKIRLDYITKSKIRALQEEPVEYNGQISVDPSGVVIDVTSQEGQTMDICRSGCVANYHTHPPDYIELYPDHPSPTDMKYIHSVTCSRKEVGAHFIFTPKYIYAIWYRCRSHLMEVLDTVLMTTKIDILFRKLAARHDRSTNYFRDDWANGLRELGFTILIFKYEDNVEFDVEKPNPHSPRRTLYIIAFIVFFLFFLQIKSKMR